MKTSSVKKPLYGHTSPDTAYVIDDYPYGFRLRCKIRYWVEDGGKKGYRMCSQTTNPKRSGEVWNKPKATTYALLAGALYLDTNEHVEFATLTEFSEPEQCLEFLKDFPKFENTKRLGIWAVKKLEYCYQFATGKAHWTINNVKQETSEADLGRYRKEAEGWSQLAKKCGAKYPDFVDKELGL